MKVQAQKSGPAPKFTLALEADSLNSLTVAVGFPKEGGINHPGAKEAAVAPRAVFKNDRLVIFMSFFSILYSFKLEEKISFLFLKFLLINLSPSITFLENIQCSGWTARARV